MYDNGTKTNLSRLKKKTVNYGAKVIFGRKKYDHVSDLLDKLGWLSSESLVTCHTSCMGHRVRCLGEPEDLAACLVGVAERREAREVLDRTARQDRDLCMPQSLTDMEKRHLPLQLSRPHALLYFTV